MTSETPFREQLYSRFAGSLLGALIGDCHGSPFEFSGRPNVKSVSDHLERYRSNKCDRAKGGEGTTLSYTDDTAMTRSVAASLISCRGYDAVDMGKRFAAEYAKEPDRGYGYNVTTVFRQIHSGKYDDDIYRPAREQFDGSGSYGNGGAMRIAPLALFQFGVSVKASAQRHSTSVAVTPTLPTVKDISQDLPDGICVKSTKLTHSNSLGYNGALLQCLAIKLALREGLSLNPEPLEMVKGFIDNLIIALRAIEQPERDEDGCSPRKKRKIEETNNGDDDSDDGDDEDDGFEEGDAPSEMPYTSKLITMRGSLDQRKSIARSSSDPLGLKPVVRRLGNSVAAYGSVPTAIYCFLRAVADEAEKSNVSNEEGAQSDSLFADFNGFERAIFYAICCGGDTDTIASMAGAIAGAYWGVDAILDSLIDSCEGADEAREAAKNLVGLTF